LLREALKELRKNLDVDETKGKAQEESRKNIVRGQMVGINVIDNRSTQFVPPAIIKHTDGTFGEVNRFHPFSF